MRKAVLLFLVFVSLLGCENQKTNQVGKKDKKEFVQSHENLLKFINKETDGNVSLLSVKYSISEKVLKEIIQEYEEMTFLNLFEEESKVIGVQEAINKLSSKYQIKEDFLASILIEKKSMEKCSE